MNKGKLNVLIAILLTIGIANVYSGYVNVFTEGIGKQYHFQTQSGDFEFTAIPSKGRDTKMMMRQYENHLKEKGTEREEIYRTFRGNPLKFWNWYTYSTNELYQFDYKKRENRS